VIAWRPDLDLTAIVQDALARPAVDNVAGIARSVALERALLVPDGVGPLGLERGIHEAPLQLSE